MRVSRQGAEAPGCSRIGIPSSGALLASSSSSTLINPLLAFVELSVVRGAIILPLLELSGNIWLIARPDE